MRARAFATQPWIDDDWADALAAQIAAGARPVVSVFRAADGALEVADGHHRLSAYLRAGVAPTIEFVAAPNVSAAGRFWSCEEVIHS